MVTVTDAETSAGKMPACLWVTGRGREGLCGVKWRSWSPCVSHQNIIN